MAAKTEKRPAKVAAKRPVKIVVKRAAKPSTGQVVYRTKGRATERAYRVESIGLSAPNSLAVADEVRKGLSVEAFGNVLAFTALPSDVVLKATDISERTLARRKKEGRFDPHESERLLRFGRIFEKAVDLFGGNREAATHWFRQPHRALGERRPLDLVETEPGGREVEELIGRIEHGVFG